MPLRASLLLQHHEQHISFVGSGVANCRGHISWLRLFVWRTYGIEHIRFDKIAHYTCRTLRLTPCSSETEMSKSYMIGRTLPDLLNTPDVVREKWNENVTKLSQSTD
jgi:hypothetical protein